jgi:uncharacterized protein (DUF1015 family)
MPQSHRAVGVKPFSGIRYTPDLVGDLSPLLCPPYDIISLEEQRQLYRKSPYNMIRLEHPLPGDGDVDEMVRYRTAAQTYREWRDSRILVPEGTPAMYVHDHSFVFRGKGHVRRGLIASVLLRPWYQGVYPHELTGTKAKQDRLELMSACRTSFSYPLGLYEDAGSEIGALIEATVKDSTPIEVREEVDEHRFWAVCDSQALARIYEVLERESIYVADGHHRYETGLVYQAERRAAETGDERHPSRMIHSDDPRAFTIGSFISPVYSVLRGSPARVGTYRGRLMEYFSLDFVPIETAWLVAPQWEDGSDGSCGAA